VREFFKRMKTALAILAALLCAAAAPMSARAAQCGLPDTKPLWIDFTDGTVPFGLGVFGKPGITIATTGFALPPRFRELGAGTVYWEMKLGLIVGTTTAPADPAVIPDKAQRLFDRAVASSGCSTPYIALNELNGATTTTPWTASNAGYRANVLQLMQELAAKGARPFLLVNSPPYTDADAGNWWRQVAQVGDIVPEVYFNSPAVSRQGVILGSRRMRTTLRAAIAAYTAIGIPVSKLGFVLGFQSGPGAGGREGLQPSSAWFEFAKLYTLAAKRVAAEFGIATVWSWGWGTFNVSGADPDKQATACVYLWTREPSLCDGPVTAGKEFETSLTEGQLDALGKGVQCSLDGRAMFQTDLSRMAAVTRDRDVAFTILFDRLVAHGEGRVSPERIVEAKRAIVDGKFRGSRRAYNRALARGHANPVVARAAIEDELLRADAEASLRVPAPMEAQVRTFYDFYPDALARRFRVKPAAPWLGGRTSGFALASAAPAAVFRLPAAVASPFTTGLGSYTVTPLDAPVPLGALPYESARAAIRRALVSFARTQAYESSFGRRVEKALNRTICLRDDLPSPAVVSVSTYLPFLALSS
jgi:hypothetical protein